MLDTWTPQAVPGPGDRAVFSLGVATPYTVTLVGPVSNDALVVHTDQVALDLGGATYSLTNGDRGLIVGDSPFSNYAWLRLANGSMNVSAGAAGKIEVAITQPFPALVALSPYKITGVTANAAAAEIKPGDEVKIAAQVQADKPDVHALHFRIYGPDGRSAVGTATRSSARQERPSTP